MSKKSGSRSPTSEAALFNSMAYVRNTILDLAKRAESGDRHAVDRLFEWLEKYPQMRSLIRQLDDLADRAEQIRMERMFGKDELSKKGMRDHLETIRNELLGSDPSVTDRLMAGTVIIAHLDFQRAAMAAAVVAEQPGVREARERLLSMAQKRLQGAIRGWSLYRRKKSERLLRRKISLFEPSKAG